MGCLYKLSAVTAGFARQQILFCSLIPHRDTSCSRISPPSPSFALVFVFSAGRSVCWCVAGLKLCVHPGFNVFVLVHAAPPWPAPAHPLTTLCCGSMFSPAPHLNVKPPPGGSHLSLGGMNTL